MNKHSQTDSYPEANNASKIRLLEEKIAFSDLLLDNIYTGIAVFSYDGIILFGNTHALSLVGGNTIDEVRGMNIRDFVEKEFHPNIEMDFSVLKSLKQGYSTSYIICDLKKREKWIEIHATEITYNNCPSVLAAIRDVTIQKKFQEALQESQELFKTTVDISHDGMVMINRSFQIVYVNSELCSILGRSSAEIIGHDFREFISDTDKERVAEYYQLRQKGKEAPPWYEFSVLRKDGSERRIELRATVITNPNGIMLTVAQLLDVTEKRQMEEELLNMRKLESVGLLAGGIAHDFNNILNAILGNLSLTKINHAQHDEKYSLIDEAEKAVLRAKGLTNQLLTFSKGGAPIKRKTDIARLIRDAVNFSLAGSNIKCRFTIDDKLNMADVDEGQIHQAIHNLVINAKQAMPEGGFIDITAKNYTISGKDTAAFGSNMFIMVSIRDYGHGIRKEHLPKVFDPYFTTKNSGQGLGLASVYSIVSRHGGRVTAESKLNSGSVFTIYIPALENENVEIAGNEAEMVIFSPIQCCILFMDDEEIVRSVAEKMLRHIGCDVVTAHEGSDAIKKYTQYRDSGKPFDAVIMDLTIPGGMGGKETIVQLRDIDPDVRAIVSSGYCNDPVMSQFREYGFVDVIAKPFRIDDLSLVLKRVLSCSKV